jgi:hypothetical protein
MKAKLLTLIAITAVVTLSFTFASVKESPKKSKVQTTASAHANEPVGGFVFEEK